MAQGADVILNMRIETSNIGKNARKSMGCVRAVAGLLLGPGNGTARIPANAKDRGFGTQAALPLPEPLQRENTGP